MNDLEVVDRHVILDAAHPRRLNEGLRHPRRAPAELVLFYFEFPGLPERRARCWHGGPPSASCATPARSTWRDEIERYVEAWSEPGAAKAMIDYYRAAVRLGSKQEIRPISAPTLVIWGQGDRYLGPSSPAAPRRRAQPRPCPAPPERPAGSITTRPSA